MPMTKWKNDGWFTGKLFAGANKSIVPYDGENYDIAATPLAIVKATHSGKIGLLNRAAGCVITLPAATGKGDVYRFFAITATTTNGYIFKVNPTPGTDTMWGFVHIALAAGGGDYAEGAVTSDDTLTLNGTTSGGWAGSYVEFRDVKAGLWMLEARLVGSGTLATTGLLTATVP